MSKKLPIDELSDVPRWVKWSSSVVITVFTLMTFLYTTFLTKTEAQQTMDLSHKNEEDYRQSIDKRLERIEGKLDKALYEDHQE